MAGADSATGLSTVVSLATVPPLVQLKEPAVKKWKPLALCAALIVGGFAFAQDMGFQPPINSGLNVPISAGDPADWNSYGSFNDFDMRRTLSRGAPKSRAHGMTAEQIAASLEAVRVQKEALDQWEKELRAAALTKRMSSLGAITYPPAPPAQVTGFSFGGSGAMLFGGQ
jgi:hypothetical protein